jgi:hypothetical protein
MTSLKVLLAVLVLVVAGAQTQAQEGSSCSNATLSGSYASTVSGQLFHADGTAETRQGLVVAKFDGHGTFTQTDYVLNTANGVTTLTPGPVGASGFQIHESGTYHVNADCTGSMEIHFAPPPVPGAIGAILKLHLVIGSQGNALRTVVISVTPPSIVPNDITGNTLHSEGTRVGEVE